MHAVHENPFPLQMLLALDFAVHRQTPNVEAHFQLHLSPVTVSAVAEILRGDEMGSCLVT